MRRENVLALGIVLIIVALVILSLSNSPTYGDKYVQEAIVDNSNQASLSVVVSAHFDAGQHLFFNFTKGHYWGNEYDDNNGGLDPGMDIGTNCSIPSYKEIYFSLYMPSGDNLSVGVYLAGGTDPYIAVLYNQSAEFTPLSGANETFQDVGLEGITNVSGTYTVEGESIYPLILRTTDQTYSIVASPGIGADPPLNMGLWNIETVESKPYLIPFVTLGTILIASGAVSLVWTGKPRRRPNRHNKRIKKT